MEDRRVLAPMTYMVTSTADNGSNSSPTSGSLRWAIKQANANTNERDTIDFSSLNSSQRVLAINANGGTSEPLLITEPVIIDGTTADGYSGSPLIEIVKGTTTDVPGLLIQVPSGGISSQQTQLKSLKITGFDGVGVSFGDEDEASPTWVNNFLITNSHILNNGHDGIMVRVGSSNQSEIAGSLISGNEWSGIHIGSKHTADPDAVYRAL